MFYVCFTGPKAAAQHTPTHTPTATHIYTVLGGWDYDKAQKLEKKEHNGWQAVVPIPSDELADFQVLAVIAIVISTISGSESYSNEYYLGPNCCSNKYY